MRNPANPLSPVLVRARLLFPPVNEPDQSFISHCAVAGPFPAAPANQRSGMQEQQGIKEDYLDSSGFPQVLQLNNRTRLPSVPLTGITQLLKSQQKQINAVHKYSNVSSKDDEIQERNIHGNDS